MQTEIEAKFSKIDLDEMRGRLKKLGATMVYPERMMRRHNFDWADGERAFVRVRDEGDRVTMTYKRVDDRSFQGTKEVNLVVDSYEQAVQFLEALGMTAKAYQETKRELWHLADCEVVLDTWPWVPSILEVEGPSESSVRSVADQLGLDWSRVMHGTVEPVYQEIYDVTEDEVNTCKRIAFGPVPEWLEKKRRKN